MYWNFGVAAALLHSGFQQNNDNGFRSRKEEPLVAFISSYQLH